jgi:hypothetical protein
METYFKKAQKIRNMEPLISDKELAAIIESSSFGNYKPDNSAIQYITKRKPNWLKFILPIIALVLLIMCFLSQTTDRLTETKLISKGNNQSSGAVTGNQNEIAETAGKLAESSVITNIAPIIPDSLLIGSAIASHTENLRISTDTLIAYNVFGKVKVYPNPAFNEAVCEYYLKKPTKVTITIHSIDGAYIKTAMEPDIQAPGNYIIHLNLYGMKTGAYLLAISSEEGEKAVMRLAIKK